MKLLIWDFNGTILDDVNVCLKIENHMLKERGLKDGFTVEQYKDLFTFPVINYYKLLGYTFGENDESYDSISDEFNEAYDQHFDEIGLCEGFQEKILESLEKGYENIILSASEQGHLEDQCQRLGITKYFTQLIGTDNLLAHGKIEHAKIWMKQAGIRPEDCKYLGDTTHDADTAKALGIQDVILIASGHQSRRVLEQSCETVLDSLKEVEL